MQRNTPGARSVSGHRASFAAMRMVARRASEPSGLFVDPSIRPMVPQCHPPAKPTAQPNVPWSQALPDGSTRWMNLIITSPRSEGLSPVVPHPSVIPAGVVVCMIVCCHAHPRPYGQVSTGKHPIVVAQRCWPCTSASASGGVIRMTAPVCSCQTASVALWRPC